MKKNFIYIFFLLICIKLSFANDLTKKDLLKMSPSQIIVFANNGDSMAQLWLGDAIYNGSIPNWKSYSICEWYYKSANQNNSEAAFKLYEYLHNFKVGSKINDCPKIIGIERPNLDKNYWLSKAARLNNPRAQLRLYDDSRSSDDKNVNEIGLRWLKKSVKNNFPPAITQLAHLYLHGSQVKKDIDKAIKLYSRASKLDTKNETADRQLAEIYSNQRFLNDMASNDFQLKRGKISQENYESTKKFLKKYDYTNYFDIQKAIYSAENCIQKGFGFSCYLMIINYYTEKKYNNINYDEALMWLNEAEDVLKKSDFYHTILTTKGWAYLTWDNLKVNKLKAREYFQKAIDNYKKSRFASEKRIKLYEKWIKYTY